jgi:Tfp pilus assembly protein PilV
VEVLVAIAFFAVVSVGLAGLAIGVINGNARSRELDIAVYLAHDWLETMRNTPYASITAAKFPEQGYGTITVGPESLPDFKRSVAIQNNTPTTGMTRVVVTVTSRRGGNVSEEMVVGPWQQ